MKQQINGDVQETVDTLDYLWRIMLSVWESFPVELKAFMLAMFVISILMQWIKKAVLADLPKRARIRALWLYSLPLGMGLATIGWLIGEDTIDEIYWAIIGLTVGASAMGVHFVSTNVVWPGVKVIGSAVWSRVLVLIRGVPKSG